MKIPSLFSLQIMALKDMLMNELKITITIVQNHLEVLKEIFMKEDIMFLLS